MTSAVANGGKESKMGGFPIQLIPPKFVKNNIGLGFEFGVKVMVGGEDASLANASGTPALEEFPKVTKPEPAFTSKESL